MRKKESDRRRLVPAALLLVLFAPALSGEPLALLPGHLQPKALSGVDQGRVVGAMELPYLMLVLKPSATQQADLDGFLARVQDPASPDYQQWLTPEQYADRFGAPQHDVEAIVAWLKDQGLTVLSVARGRNAIAFRGNTTQIESAFATEIHRYLVNGEEHYANATNPSVPARFAPMVAAVRGLHDFRPQPAGQRVVHPDYTLFGQHFLGPGDLALIYDILPLYQMKIDGTGQKLAVAGQTQVHLFDIEQYRKVFSLPANDPHVMLVPNTLDPGVRMTDLFEADLDLETSGGVAPQASVQYVYSFNVFDSVQYIIDQNLAPVMSVSYSAGCELEAPLVESQSLQIWARQANAQGLTWVNSAGDDGGADCYSSASPPLKYSLAVDLPAAIPEVTGVGGTEFNEGTTTYWNSTNNSTNTSAKSYIPEKVWNDGPVADILGAGAGGVSTLFAKPAWQAGKGVPADGKRDVPDVSLAASASHDGYAIYSGAVMELAGGTSASAPAFAGMVTLLNQYLQAKGLGNVNPKLYALAQTPGVLAFHDITSGNNIVNPCAGQSGCTAKSVGYKAGTGYDLASGLGSVDVNRLAMSWQSAVVAQSQASMSVASNPSSIMFEGSAILTATVTGTSSPPTGSVNFSLAGTTIGSATLVEGSGTSSTATFTLQGIILNPGANTIEVEYGGDNSYLGTAKQLSVTAPSAGSETPKVTTVLDAASFQPRVAPGGIIAVYGTNLSPGTGSAPLVPLPISMAGVTCYIDGVIFQGLSLLTPAPFYFASSGQLNLQVPFEIAPGVRHLTINNNGKMATFTFTVDAAAPAIFTTNSEGTGQGSILDAVKYTLVDASNPATAGSSVLAIFCTGLGPVSNQPLDGSPAPVVLPLSETITPVMVTIGGTPPAAAPFAGLAPGLVGLYQINVQVPAASAKGNTVPVSISVGGTPSNTVTIAVQ